MWYWPVHPTGSQIFATLDTLVRNLGLRREISFATKNGAFYSAVGFHVLTSRPNNLCFHVLYIKMNQLKEAERKASSLVQDARKGKWISFLQEFILCLWSYCSVRPQYHETCVFFIIHDHIYSSHLCISAFFTYLQLVWTAWRKPSPRLSRSSLLTAPRWRRRTRSHWPQWVNEVFNTYGTCIIYDSVNCSTIIFLLLLLWISCLSNFIANWIQWCCR